tara:strand:- start:962 stop:2326 length:1365 start_codon:yes stop_codon:yes gene_type:complete
MFDHYGHKYECEFRIYTADDNKETYSSTNIEIYSTYDIYFLKHRANRYRNYNTHWDNRGNLVVPDGDKYIINTYIQSRLYSKGEPLISEIKNTLQTVLGWGGRGHTISQSPLTFKMAFVLPSCGMAVMIEKGNTYYQLMNQRVKKKNLLYALSRFIYRSCFESNPQALLQYIIRMITMPENVTYVLENRTPFWYFNIAEREKINCRLNTKLISNTEAALEISDGIWAPITINELDIMVNYFYHEHARAKTWANMSPRKLWTKLMGEEPSSSQLKLMNEFLVQNRTQDIVENRAKELMSGLEIKYPNRIKIINISSEKVAQPYQVMLVRGKLADWVIINSTYKTITQKVKTYVFINDDITDLADKQLASRVKKKINKLGGSFRGPICIDNIHSNSSLGDQYAARALALLNDNVTIKLVSTIAQYIPKSVVDGETSRFKPDWDELDSSFKWGRLVE